MVNVRTDGFKIGITYTFGGRVLCNYVVSAIGLASPIITLINEAYRLAGNSLPVF